MCPGGYQIIDFSGNIFTDIKSSVQYDGLENIINNSNKPIMVCGLRYEHSSGFDLELRNSFMMFYYSNPATKNVLKSVFTMQNIFGDDVKVTIQLNGKTNTVTVFVLA
jgi:hypothetical protein